MATGSIFHHINFRSTISVSYFLYFAIFYFPFHIPKIPKILLYRLSISIRSHSRKWPWRDWQPRIALVARFLFVCVGSRRLACGLLLDWYLGSQKLSEILTLLCCITLSSSREKPTQAQEVARMISGAIAGEVFAQVKTYQVLIKNSSPSH